MARLEDHESRPQSAPRDSRTVPREGRASWWTAGRYAGLLAVAAAVHMVQAAVLPLSGDEAYYWDISRRWAWASFDQPPLVIWAMVPFRLLLGETALAVRLPAVLASTLTGVLLLPLVRRLGGGVSDAARAFLLLQATPLFFLGSSYASTDVAMITAMVAATVASVAIAQGDRRAWWWVGLALGLGFLAKFPAVLAGTGVLAALLTSRAARRHLLTPTPYLAALVSLACTAPVWLWAVQHDFANISFQLSGRHQVDGLTLKHLGGLWGASLVLASPPLFLAVAAAWVRGWRRREAGWLVLLTVTATPFAFFSAVSVRTPVGGHWGAPGIVLGIAALALAHHRPRRLVVSGVTFGLMLSLLVIGLLLGAEPILRAREGPLAALADRLQRAYAPMVGNEQVVAEIQRRLGPGEVPAAASYSRAHLYEFLSAGQLNMHLVQVSEGKHGVDALYWRRPEELRGRDFLVVTERDSTAAELAERCGRLVRDADYAIVRGKRTLRVLRFYRCQELLRPEGALTRLPPAETAAVAGGHF